MPFLDTEKLATFPGAEFRRRKPYPWANPQGILSDDGFRTLISRLPDITLFEKNFGYQRRYGQKGHDRYSLEYDEKLSVDPVWHELVAELQQAPYRQFLKKLCGHRPMKLSFHWHYTQRGGDISPHVDSSSKIGSHIFYLNTADDWNADWGGQTLVLDDRGKLSHKSAPSFSDFADTIVANAIGNQSLVFKRTPHSWHGVKAIDCPDGYLRKVFIVVIERARPLKALQGFFQRAAR